MDPQRSQGLMRPVVLLAATLVAAGPTAGLQAATGASTGTGLVKRLYLDETGRTQTCGQGRLSNVVESAAARGVIAADRECASGVPFHSYHVLGCVEDGDGTIRCATGGLVWTRRGGFYFDVPGDAWVVGNVMRTDVAA